MTPKKLPTFKGYTIDLRLKEFRRVKGKSINFISFNSGKGEKLLSSYIKSLNPKSKEFKELIKSF